MYVYIWKHPSGTPFYVGATKFRRRTDPASPSNVAKRTKNCQQIIHDIGVHNVITEIHHALSVDEAKALERALIEEHGRLSKNTGPLVNITRGGEKRPPRSIASRALAKRLGTITAGESNIAKRPEVRAKLKAVWQDPEFKERMKLRPPVIHTEEFKETARQRLLDPSSPIREFHKVLNTDPAIKAKRVATLATTAIQEKISTKLKAGWAGRTPEQRAKQLSGICKPHSEETRAKQSAAALLLWAKRQERK